MPRSSDHLSESCDQLTTSRYPFSITVVIGVFNDAEVLPLLEQRLLTCLKSYTADWDVIFIEDGSVDDSYRILMEMAAREPRVQVLKLTRNFGQASSLAAGMDRASGDIVVLMDSDLQDRPEDIPKLIDALIEHDVHMAISHWITRQDSVFKKLLSKVFQRTVNWLTTVKIEPGMGVFRAIRQGALVELRRVSENTGPSLGLLHWMGFEHVFVDLDRDTRAAGISGYTFSRMLKMGKERIFSYSFFPIAFSTNLGMLLSLLSILLGGWFVIRKLVMGETLPGWTSLISVILFLFGINFLILGLYGQYIARIYSETRGRPKYVVDYQHSTVGRPSERP